MPHGPSRSGRLLRSLVSLGKDMNISGELRWQRALLVAALVYFLAGVAFATLSTGAASEMMRGRWRFAAWAISAAALATHVGYENFRLRSTPRTTAWHASGAVALGACALAVAALIHRRSGISHQPSLALALLVWPIVTGLPAFLIALATAAVLRRARRSPSPGPDV